MMTLSQITAALQDRRIDKVAQATGVPYSTVRSVRNGTHKNPKYNTLKALSDYLEQKRA